MNRAMRRYDVNVLRRTQKQWSKEMLMDKPVKKYRRESMKNNPDRGGRV